MAEKPAHEEINEKEMLLKAYSVQWRTTFDAINDAVCLLDMNGRILQCNKAMESLLQKSSKEIIGGICWELMHGTDKPIKGCPIVRMKKTLRRESLVLKVDDKWLNVTVDPVIDETGNLTSAVHIISDITRRKQAEKALKRLNEELLKEHNQRKILSKSLIDLLEKDRRKIAMELHDHIGQILTSIKLNLEMIHEKLKPGGTELGAQIAAVQERTIQAIKDIKNVSRGLRPAMIESLGVVSSLRELFNEIQQQTDIEIRFFSRGIPKRFEEAKELAVYRIAQEALTNIVRHARAKNVFVNLVKKDKKLLLSVEDNGVGFDQDKVMKPSKRKGSLGLLIMKERAVQLDGEFTIESQPGKGTHLLVEIPI